MLVIHICLALASLAWTTWLFFVPSRAKLVGSYGLVATTLASGTYLVINSESHILQTCLSGLAYLGVVSVGIVLARQKLAKGRAKR